MKLRPGESAVDHGVGGGRYVVVGCGSAEGGLSGVVHVGLVVLSMRMKGRAWDSRANKMTLEMVGRRMVRVASNL